MNGASDNLGYNATRVEELSQTIAKIATQTGTEIGEIIEDQIIVPLGAAWIAPEAVRYINDSFMVTIKHSGEAIAVVYNNFIKSLQADLDLWAETTEGKTTQLAQINDILIPVNTSFMKEELGGDVIITKEGCERIIGNLPEIENEIKSKLEALNSDLEAEVAFIGGGHAQAIEDCFRSLAAIVRDIFKYLAEDDDTSLQTNIRTACDNWQRASEAVRDAAQQEASANQG